MLVIPNSLESSVGKAGSITMQELERCDVIAAVLRGDITVAIAAKRLQITPRQVRRLRQRYVEGGWDAMASRRRGQPSNNRLDADIVKQALEVYCQ